MGKFYDKTNKIVTISFLVGVLIALYVSGWLLFISPILSACALFDAGALTGMAIANVVIKCLLATPIASAIIWISCFLGAILAVVFNK